MNIRTIAFMVLCLTASLQADAQTLQRYTRINIEKADGTRQQLYADALREVKIVSDDVPASSLTVLDYICMNPELDSLRASLLKYYSFPLNTSDVTMSTVRNPMYNAIGAQIDKEVGQCTILLPKNNAWQKLRQQSSAMDHYANTYTIFKGYKDSNIQTDEISINKDSIEDACFFSRLKTTDNEATSIATEKHSFGNGTAWVTDSIPPLFQPIKIEAESPLVTITTNLGEKVVHDMTVEGQNPDVKGEISGGKYIEVIPSSDNSYPKIAVLLPEVHSTEYVIYGVFVPANIASDTTTVKRDSIQVLCRYHKADGTFAAAPKIIYRSSFDFDGVTTICLGNMTFITSCYMLGSDPSSSPMPFLEITSRARPANLDVLDNHLRIDYFLLIPKQLDDQMKQPS